ncbi:MAG: nucleoside phosphorylase [Clostridiales Family XIII bacterium]|jgi:uridine phosphorylase|nr:nucleoside phosphorylase [Clostridiales Family XIII bacterium]
MMSNLNKASAPTVDGTEKVYHLQLAAGDVPKYMILPGAPERTLVIAKDWDEAKEVASYREFKTVTGKYKGVDIGTTSTGIGAASSEIAIHELSTLGVHTLIRVGTTGVIQPEYDLGDLVINTAAYRKDGTSDTYIDPAYPAAADEVVTMALMQACENLGYRYGVGVGYTVGSFYIGQGRPIGRNEEGLDCGSEPAMTERACVIPASEPESSETVYGSREGYWPSFADRLIPDLQSAGVVNIEMEAAGQFVVGRLHGLRMGAIFAVVSNRVTDKWGDAGGEEKATKAATEAIKIIHDWDKNGRIELGLTDGLRVGARNDRDR